MSIRFLRFTTTLALSVALAACSDAGPTATESGDAPALPDLASMNAEMSLFDGASGSAQGVEAAAQVGTHFLTAAVVVSVARVATVAVMSIPVATFGAAAQNTPVFRDGAFHWRYSVTEGGNSFSADLAGVPHEGTASWEMRISATGTNPPLNDFLFYTGESRFDRTSGSWRINDAGSPTSVVPVLGIEWSHSAIEVWELTFANVRSGAPEFGDRLSYSVTENRRNVSYVDASAGSATTIQWDAPTGAGSIVSPNYNGGSRACWNGARENVPCS